MTIHFLTLMDPESFQQKRHEGLDRSLGGRLIVLTDYNRRLGNLSKILRVAAFLGENPLRFADDDIVVVTNAHNVLFNNGVSVEELESYFRTKECDFLVSCENTSCDHFPEASAFMKDKYGEGCCYLNSGVQIGFYGAMVRVYQHLSENLTRWNVPFRYSDQRLLGRFLMIQEGEDDALPGVRMSLDSGQELCRVCNRSTPLDLSQTPPFFYHVTEVHRPPQKKKWEQLQAALFKGLVYGFARKARKRSGVKRSSS